MKPFGFISQNVKLFHEQDCKLYSICEKIQTWINDQMVNNIQFSDISIFRPFNKVFPHHKVLMAGA